MNKMNQFMVRQCDLRWNLIYDSILLMYQKLAALDFDAFVEGEPGGRGLRRPGSQSRRRKQ